MNTNGFRMSGEKLESLLRHEVDLLNICIDCATKEVAESIRINLKMDSIDNNILELMKLRKERGLSYPKIRAGMVVIPQNQHEVEAFAKKRQGKVDFVGVDPYSNRAGY
jgi:RNase P/RNase MRP subunit p30